MCTCVRTPCYLSCSAYGSYREWACGVWQATCEESKSVSRVPYCKMAISRWNEDEELLHRALFLSPDLEFVQAATWSSFQRPHPYSHYQQRPFLSSYQWKRLLVTLAGPSFRLVANIFSVIHEALPRMRRAVASDKPRTYGGVAGGRRVARWIEGGRPSR